MAENYNRDGQGELFPEFKVSKGRRFAYFKKDAAIGKKMVMSISWENLALVSIALIMLIALFFSIGVEKGKRMAEKNTRTRALLKMPPKKSASPADGKVSGFYTIQVMAIKKGEDVQKEVARLKAAGYDAFSAASDNWSHVCIGRYAARADAIKNLKNVELKHPGSHIRKINN